MMGDSEAHDVDPAGPWYNVALPLPAMVQRHLDKNIAIFEPAKNDVDVFHLEQKSWTDAHFEVIHVAVNDGILTEEDKTLSRKYVAWDKANRHRAPSAEAAQVDARCDEFEFKAEGTWVMNRHERA